jgi:hypothetical protein
VIRFRLPPVAVALIPKTTTKYDQDLIDVEVSQPTGLSRMHATKSPFAAEARSETRRVQFIFG